MGDCPQAISVCNQQLKSDDHPFMCRRNKQRLQTTLCTGPTHNLEVCSISWCLAEDYGNGADAWTYANLIVLKSLDVKCRWCCPQDMQGRVYVTMRRPSVSHSVRLSVPSTAAATATGGFCRRAPCWRETSTDRCGCARCGQCAAGAGTQQQTRAASCWTRLNADLLVL